MPLRHKNLYHTMTPEAFRAAVARLDADIPHLNTDEIVIRMLTIATMPEDSHTGYFGLPPGESFPLRLRHYDNGIYVEGAPPRYAAAVGGRLLAIGQTPADAIYDRLEAVIPHDTGNPGLLEFVGPVLMTMGHVLHGLDITPTADAATYVVSKGGKRMSFNLTPDVAASAIFGHAPIAGWVDARGTAPPPLWLMHPDKTFWSMYVPAAKMLYIQFNAVRNAPDQTIAHFFGDTFAAARAERIDKLVLDIRMNDGGNNALLRPIIVGLIQLTAIDRRGHLFVVTSRNTYSAAQNLVNRLELYTEAIFVGQPTGQHVNSYGDPAEITLPNSHLRVGMASVWWQDMDERDKRIETDPELAADLTFADYVANRDPALDEIMHYRPEQSLEDTVFHGVAMGGVQRGLAAYQAYAADPIHRYVRAGMERRLNTLGYKLLHEHLHDAIAVFTVNCEANPTSANAADSLGEAYADAGDRANAIASYRKALQLDPKFESSRAALVRLGVPP
ncbi:MAG: hypothetical protein JO101_01935 [Candidatus Eremiobacteraeota bacterium]|nr:hypothetical protein [Candidatus Eremiobacteraeota bacterium]